MVCHFGGFGVRLLAFSRAHDMASEYRMARVVVIDQIPQIEFDLPTNMEFQRHDINDGLEPFYGQFDLVHARCIASGVMRYREFIDEARKCLRPGGIAIFIEGDFDLVTEDQATIQEPASDTNPNGSWLLRWMQGKLPFHR
jgi:SAM-dependent methyltransferase